MIYLPHENVLEGRLAQVVDLYFLSSSTRKQEYSQENHGVAVCIVGDRALPRDDELRRHFQSIESDIEGTDEENE